MDNKPGKAPVNPGNLKPIALMDGGDNGLWLLHVWN